MTKAASSKGRSKKAPTEVVGFADPRAPLDTAAFLIATRAVLRLLNEDLLDRTKASASVKQAMVARHAAESAAHRTGDAFEEWQRRFVGQVADAWVLSCVFVRTLEDRGLLGGYRIAGPGAMDSQRVFDEMAPSLNERDYLLTIFRELARMPAAKMLFDARWNPVWKLAPSAKGARVLLELFRTPTVDAPVFRFGQPDTRFLGDLYQDLDEDVRERFALLQTPKFVEAFILNRALTPALRKFGVDDTTLLDPTCGSGHFLLGAFESLFDGLLRAHPALPPRETARRALVAIAGVDLNPYAVAIARFRLTLAFLEKAQIYRLADAPAPTLNVVVGDSLLQVGGQTNFADRPGQTQQTWQGEQLSLEDEEATKSVLSLRYGAVVGNPPYITVKDAVVRERYRQLYVSAAGKYALSAPFTERFFQLAREGGFVGMINANSFMKREFGKTLIEQVLPKLNLTAIYDTAGAYIPGHGTPTALIFGTAEPPVSLNVHAVLGCRGEPSTPKIADQGHVWRSIAEHGEDVGFENEYVTVTPLQREKLKKHPWCLGGGGAIELREALESRASARLIDGAVLGVGGMSNADDIYIGENRSLLRMGIPMTLSRPLVVGEEVRDWMNTPRTNVFFPYDAAMRLLVPLPDGVQQAIWPFKAVLWARAVFGGGTYRSTGRPWYEWHQLTRERYLTPLSIALAEVATHNHFVLDRGGKVFKQTAPIIKLPGSASEEDHLSLLGYLNSSTACFWMKQCAYPKGTHSEARPEKGIPEDNRYAFSSTAISKLPVFGSGDPTLISLCREMDRQAQQRDDASPEVFIARWAPSIEASLPSFVFKMKEMERQAFQRMVVLQEDMDFYVYGLVGLSQSDAGRPFSSNATLAAEERPFLSDAAPTHLNGDDSALWRLRKEAIASSPQLRLIEEKVYKRRWWGARGVFALKAATFEERIVDSIKDVLLDELEDLLMVEASPVPLQDLSRRLGLRPKTAALLSFLGDGDSLATVLDLLVRESVPFAAVLRHSNQGLEKRRSWEKVWLLQRREDQGDKVGHIDVPKRYDLKDFRDPNIFRLRGKLDVPKERFISYPGCQSDQDGEPLYGWAGWNHLQRSQALTALYQKRKTDEAWPKERLVPLLAGLLELIPWVKQWHNEPSAEFSGLRLGDYFETFLLNECHRHNLTQEDLRAWRPSPSTGRQRRSPKKGGSAKTAGDEVVS